MHRLITCLISLALLTGLSFEASAQQMRRITVSLSSAPFESFIQTVEEQTDLRFFYNSTWTDTLRVTMNASSLPLNTVLEQVFSGTSLHYSIYGDAVFITPERQILTELPTDFFNEEKRPQESADVDYTEFLRKEKQKAMAEEKLYQIGTKTNILSGRATIAGTIRDMKSGEPIIGAAVYIEDPMIGVATDQFGRYAITLNKGRHVLVVKSMGMKTTKRQVMLYDNGKLDIEVEEDILPLKEIIVEAERDVRVTGMQMGREKLDIKTMKNIPLALGETDIIKVILTLPGVQAAGEGTSGINVRGGATSQNLILYNDAVIFNPSHLFGFFSTFNPDILKNVELYKSGITADYGGRLSSVLDVRTREGNLKKLSGSGGISPITGRLSLEGPIIKDKSSFLIGARSTYSDWLLKQLDSKELQNSEAAFFDLNASISHQINDDNAVYVSA